VTCADHERAERAVQAAVRAFDTVRSLSSGKRRDLLQRVARLMLPRRPELARVIARDSGKPLNLAEAEVDRTRLTLELSADEAVRPTGQVVPLDLTQMTEGCAGYWSRLPIGPLLAFAPFNFPLNLVAHKVGPAMAAGCSVVLKPPPQAPLASLMLARMFWEVGAPPDFFQVVPCDITVAERLVRDDRFAALAFTGSAKVGWHLKTIAGRKRVLLELGGNGAVIVHEDTAPDFAAERVATAAFAHAGQVCIKAQRAYVHEAIYDQWVRRIVDISAAMRPSATVDAPSVVGPMIDLASAERVAAWVDEARLAGARVLVGGRREGTRMDPTVVEIEGSGRGLKLVDEEVFGPVLTVHKYSDWDDALQMADDTKYGLQAGIFTDSQRRIRQAFAKLNVGCLVVNDAPAVRTDSTPFGGTRHSGTGREGVPFMVEHLTEPKLLVIREQLRSPGWDHKGDYR
jgi:acyl-CoA reductase-like NAD-dependent aldehyde dehydrogenase